MPISVPKPERKTKEQRQSERKTREPNPFKPVFTKKAKPERIPGTSFRQKLGRRRLLRVYKVADRKVKAIHRKPMAKGKPLKFQGRRGRRLAPGDRKAAQSIKGLACICGCNQPVSWGHLQTRSAESTRHLEWASVPVCSTIHPGWLDQGRGVKCREELFDLAKSLGRRLTHADAYPLLSRWGFYTQLADRRVMER
jgi:hypothetical protein